MSSRVLKSFADRNTSELRAMNNSLWPTFSVSCHGHKVQKYFWSRNYKRPNKFTFTIMLKFLVIIFREGFEKKRVSSILHQIELGLKHQKSNFGLSIVMVRGVVCHAVVFYSVHRIVWRRGYICTYIIYLEWLHIHT